MGRARTLFLLAAVCSQSALAFPLPEEIEKLVCKVASSDMVEKEATEEVCKLIKEHFPSVKMQPDCETVVGALWDNIKARCPKRNVNALAFPTPKEIEKLVCELASKDMIEKEATEEVCKLIKKKLPWVPDCEKVVGALWNEIKAHCPKGEESMVAFPTPAKIEKLVCELASKNMIEKEATEEVCKLIKNKFPLVPDCEQVVGALWKEIKAHCPKGEESTVGFPSPEDIEKIVCKLASAEIVEKKATEEICKLIKEHFPSVKMQPDCETVVGGLWDAIKARCPKGGERAPALIAV